ncbi:unnamed protein product [Closterium sp. NIES-64]|nr:unnamed protein product [Closterium sp. NIES-64]
MRFCWTVHWAAVGAAVGGAVAARRGAVGARGGAAGDVSRQQVTTSRVWTTSRVLDSEWHHGQWQAMTQADRIFHTALRWLLVLLIGICTGLLAFFVNISVEAIGGAKFGLVFSHIKGQNFLGGFLVLAATNLGLVLVSTCLCNGIAMEAVGSGIPEVKGYLNGVSTPAVLSAKTLIVKVIYGASKADSGIPEVKEHLNGVSTPAVLSAKTLLVKALGSIAAVAGGLAGGKEGPLALGSIAAVAGGLAVGKEGPLVHCGACIASILGRLSHRISARRDLSRPRKPRIQTANSVASLGLFFNHGSIKALRTPVWVHSDRGLRDLVTCGAASGVASAFLSPVGGVLFALEQVTSWTPVWVHSDRGLRDLVTCGAASEIAAAFLAPVGGALFALEQVTSWWRNSLIWRIFFTNAVVAMVLRACISLCEGDRCGGSFGSRGFILFDRSKSRTDFGLLEVVPVALLGIVGGLLGGLFNHLNVKLCAFRKSKLHRHGAWVRVLEVLLISLLTSALRFYGPFLASCLPCPQDPDEGGDLPQGSFNCPSIVGTGDHKAFACPDGQYNDLASLVFTTNDDAIGNLFRTGSFGIFTYPSLLLSFTIYFLLATLTYGTAVPAGLFVPSILCGASYGRMAGMVMVTLFGPHRVGEGTYALLGAASFLGGSMRMTVSLSVILLELTGSLKLLPLVMVVLLVSKSVGDLFNRNIEDSHVDLKGIPYLPENCTHQDFTLFEEDGEEGEEVGAGVLSRVTADSKHQQQQQQQQQQKQQEQQQQKQKQLVTGMGCSFDAAAGISSPNSPSMTLQQTTPFPRSPTVTFVVTPAVTPSITSLAVTPLLVSSPSAALLSPRSPTTPSEAPQKGSPTTPSEAPQKGSPTTPSGTLTNPANPVSPRTNPFSPRGTTPLTSSTPASPRCTNPVSPRTSPFIPRGTAPFTPRTPRRRATAGDAVGAAASGVFSAGSAGAAAGVSAGAGTATAAGSAISAGVAAASGATSAGCLVALEGGDGGEGGLGGGGGSGSGQGVDLARTVMGSCGDITHLQMIMEAEREVEN